MHRSDLDDERASLGERPPRPGYWVTFALLFAIQLLVAYLNRRHLSEQGIFEKSIMPVAQWYMGGRMPATVTFPLWGYPALIALVRSTTLLLVVQAALGSAALALMHQELSRRFVAHRRAVNVLIFGALPWFTLTSVKWPIAVSHAFIIVAVILLSRAITARSARRAALAGLVLGVALNVRSEFILYPLMIGGLALVLHLLRRRDVLPWRQVATFGAVAWLCLIPWGMWYRHWTGTTRFVSSNGGFVALMSLGQLPNNPWAIVHNDWWTMSYMRRHNMDHLYPFGHEADMWFKREFNAKVKEHPIAYAGKVLFNVRSIYTGGFYNGDPRTTPQQDTALDILKEKIKLKIGVAPNHVEIRRYTDLGVWNTLRPSAATLAGLAYLIAAGIAGVLYIFAATAGVMVVRRALFTDPFFLLAGTVIFYQWIVVIAAIQYQPRHVNTTYPWLAVFVCALWASLSVWWNNRRLRRTPAPVTPAATA